MEKILKIVSVGDIKTASNKRDYRVVSFKSVKFIGNLQVTSNQSPISRVLWDEFTDESGNKFKQDPLFQDLKTGEVTVGGAVEGSLISFNTSEYLIPGSTKPVNSYTMVIFSNEYNNATAVANRALKANHACVIDSEGILTAVDNLKKEALVPQD